MLKVEHLVVFEEAKTRISDVNALRNVINGNSKIQLDGDRLTLDNYIIFIHFTKGISKISNEVSFFIRYQSPSDDGVEKFKSVIKEVKSSLSHYTRDIIILRDDISLHYSNLAYPEIHKIENLMRELIARLMTSVVGVTWLEDRIPNSLLQIANKRTIERSNYLHNLDFIQLSELLFSENYPNHKEKLIQKIKDAKDLSKFNLTEIQSVIPNSNWNKYFKNVVKIEKEYIEKRWGKLYEFRNKIAHNTIFTKTDYRDTLRLIEEIKLVLNKAIEEVNNIVMSDTDKEDFENSMFISLNHSKVKEFVDEYELMVRAAKNLLYRKLEPERPSENLAESTVFSYLQKKHNVLDSEKLTRIFSISKIVKETRIEDSQKVISIKKLKDIQQFVNKMDVYFKDVLNS